MSIIQSIILAIIEGITEFLPISSTGHMIIGSSVMGIASLDFTKAFTVAIQLGAILSVIVLYWKRFFQSMDFYFKLIVAFIPAVIFGLLFSKKIDELLERVDVVGYTLLLGGIILLFVDKWFAKNEVQTSKSGGRSLDAEFISNENKEQEVSYPKALVIGFFQVIAMVPGVSRSAATIVGGLTQKLNRKTAAEFSFFLAVPTMFAATAKKLYDFYKHGAGFTGEEIKLLAVGNVVAFIVALFAIKFFIDYLTKYGFKLFGYYRILLGGIILALYFLGYNLAIA